MNELAVTPTPDRSFYTFRVHGRLYGLDLGQVREVSTQVACTPVPQAPALVRGLANLRSRIYLVLDAGAALRGNPSECTSDSRLVVLQDRVAPSAAMLVDRGGDVVRVPVAEIEAVGRSGAGEASAESHASAVVALCKLDSELMMVVDPARLAAALETAIR